MREIRLEPFQRRTAGIQDESAFIEENAGMIDRAFTCTTWTGLPDFVPYLEPPHFWVKRERNDTSRIRLNFNSICVTPRFFVGLTSKDHQMAICERLSSVEFH